MRKKSLKLCTAHTHIHSLLSMGKQKPVCSMSSFLTIDLYLFSGSVQPGRLYDLDQKIISHFLLPSRRRRRVQCRIIFLSYNTFTAHLLSLATPISDK